MANLSGTKNTLPHNGFDSGAQITHQFIFKIFVKLFFAITLVDIAWNYFAEADIFPQNFHTNNNNIWNGMEWNCIEEQRAHYYRLR